jgi:uncharacterized membrane protein YcfT
VPRSSLSLVVGCDNCVEDATRVSNAEFEQALGGTLHLPSFSMTEEWGVCFFFFFLIFFAEEMGV